MEEHIHDSLNNEGRWKKLSLPAIWTFPWTHVYSPETVNETGLFLTDMLDLKSKQIYKMQLESEQTQSYD